MRRNIGAVLTILLLATLGSAQQGNSQGDQAQLETIEVVVNAVVLDKDKRPVTGLTAADFEVLEDGKPQPITGMRAVSGRGGAAVATGSPAASAEFATYHTIVVTDGTVQDIHMVDVRAALEKYVREVMGPNDYVTLFTITVGGLKLLLPTTNDKQALLTAIGNAKDGGLGTLRDAERAGLDLTRVKLPDDTYSTYVAPGQGEGEITGPALAREIAPNLPPDTREVMLRLARTSIERAEEIHALGTSWTVYDALAGLIDSHRVIPGRRSVTIFSEGFEQSRQAELAKAKVFNAAAAVGVTLNVVDARGLSTEGDRGSTSRAEVDRNQNAARLRGNDRTSERTSSVGGGIFDAIPRETMARTDILAQFAAETGGLFMKNSNDLFSGLAQIDTDMRNYYVLFYTPQASWEGGEYRKIQVRVRNKAGVTVRARDGYFAVPVEARGLFRLEDQRLFIKAQQTGPAQNLPFSVRAYAFGVQGGGTRISYALKVPGDAITLQEKDKRFVGTYYGLLVARDAGNRILATERIPVPLDLGADDAKRIRAEGLRLEGGFDVLSGDVAHLDTIFSAEESGKIGTAKQPVHGLDWSSGPSLSDLVLGNAVIAPEASGEASFQTGGKYIVPLTKPVFHTDETINILAAVYWPDGRSMQPPVLSVWQGKQLLASVKADIMPGSGGANGWVFTAIPCKDIPPGDYLMRLLVRDTQGRTSMRETTFTVQ